MITVTVLVDGDAVIIAAPSLELAATVGEIIFPLDPEVFFEGAEDAQAVLETREVGA